MENFKIDDDLRPFFDALRKNVNQPMSLDMVSDLVTKMDKNKKTKNTTMSIIITLFTAIVIAFMHLFTPKDKVSSTFPEYALSPTGISDKEAQNKYDKSITSNGSGSAIKGIEIEKTGKLHPNIRIKKTASSNTNTFISNKQRLNEILTSTILSLSKKSDEDTLPFDSLRNKLNQTSFYHPHHNRLEFPFPVLKLSIEELEKIGIYSGYDGIFYESVKYTDKPFQFYYLPTISGVRNQSLDGHYKNYFPVMLSDRYFHRVFAIKYNLDDEIPFAKKISIDKKKAMTKDLIPVIAYANSNPTPTFYDEQIFWFKKTEEIIALMPLNVQQDIRDGKYIWDLTQDSIPFSAEISEIEKKILVTESSHKNGELIPFDSNYAIYADQTLLRKLNFIPNTPWLDYRYKSVKFSHTTHINAQTNDTSYMINKHYGKQKHIIAAQKIHKTPLYKFEHPIPFSASWVNEIGTGGVSYTPYQNYILQKHALIPVIVSSPHRKSQNVFWYYPSPNFMSLLNVEQLKTANLYLQKHKKDSLILSHLNIETNYPDMMSFKDLRHTSKPAFNFTKLEFDSVTLRKLGIVIHDKSVSYFFKSDSSFIETNFSKKGTQILFDQKSGINYSTNTALIITDDLGNFPRMSLDSSVNINQIDFNLLVPVYAKSHDSYTNIDKLRHSWRPDVIFWYQPDSNFLACLPQHIAIPMAHDVQSMENKSIGNTCTYFDACKTQMTTINSYKFFPNPASHMLNIDIKTSIATSIKIQLFDMSGRSVLEESTLNTSENQLKTQINISQLPSGIYNLILETQHGDKIISRIVIMN